MSKKNIKTQHNVSYSQLYELLSVAANAIKSVIASLSKKADKDDVYTKEEIDGQLKAATVRVWEGTAEEYNALTSVDANTLYVIVDDGSIEAKGVTEFTLSAIWTGTKEAYDALETKDSKTLYIIS